MSDIKARYVGPSQTGVDLRVDLGDGDSRHVHVPYGGELPTEIDGVTIPASYRDSLLEQKDNWTQVKRDSASARKGDK